MDVKHLQGLLLILGFIYSVSSQCSTIANCKTCASANGQMQCLECEELYGQNVNGTFCCSKGCTEDSFGHRMCNTTTGHCIYSCLNSFYGPTCEPCNIGIQFCDNCDYPQDKPTILQCIICATGFELTTNKEQCCLHGCDACNGQTCTVCKTGYFLYSDRCDICGNNCNSPVNGSARCNPTTGECHLGCMDGWHGLNCDVECTLNSCDTCAYNNDILTCVDCQPGYYGDYCTPCGVNCLPSTTIDICYQDGTCVTDGCYPGFRSNKCDIACEASSNMANCNECERYEFTCTSCKDNYWGNVCQHSCNEHCVTYQGSRKCSLQEGTCETGCNAGYYQHDCSGACPYCANDICDRTNGYCSDPICLPGHHGLNCNFTCPTNCALDPDTLEAHCSIEFGNCTHGCIDGKWGSFCEKGCNIHCSPSPSALETGPLCAQRDGSCDFACQPDYYRQDCSAQCKSPCVDKTCDINNGNCTACDITKGLPAYLCPSGTCEAGKYGQYCQSNCTDNCFLTCGRYNGSCFGCDSGYHGISCDLTCGHCSSGACDQKTGVCESDCSPGYWNVYCNQTCLHAGCKTCFMANGVCDVCDDGFYEVNCDRNCSAFCARNSLNSVTCDKVTGACDEFRCLPEYWNKNCDMHCNANCLRNGNEERTCAFDTGDCDFGCEDKFYGGHCSTHCSSACTDELCDRDGSCSVSCVNGAYGDRCADGCSETCNDGKCDRISGRCEECEKKFEERTPLCRNATCETPYSGLECDLECSTHCKNGVCGRYDAVCNSCDADYWGDTCLKRCGNCTGNTCDQRTGACAEECDNGFYSANCTKLCIYAGCKTCHSMTGECTLCKAEQWGDTCGLDCSENCSPDTGDGQIYCNRYTASCDMNACVPGYYHADCRGICSPHCGLDLSGSQPCDIETGKCDAPECEATWYGLQCNTECPANCANRTCSRNGTCVEGCIKGYWGPMCQTSCQPKLTCNDGTCDQGQGHCVECYVDNPTPRCPDAECDPINTWGLFCKSDCPANCADGTCSRDNGTCSSCMDTTHGEYCRKDCNNCRNNKCYQVDGVCKAGCVDGWYTLQCTTQCNHDGCQVCDRDTGECITCKEGLYGNNCSSTCARTCAEDSNGVITCNRFSGECDMKACMTGYYTPQCTETCSDYCEDEVCDLEAGTCEACIQGWYGQKCAKECSSRCKNNDCVVLADNCRQQCTDGYWGSRCEKLCNSNCDNKACNKDTAECLYGCTGNSFYELTCDEPCGGNCVDDICNRTGYCLKGCDVGWYGEKCQFECQPVSRCTNGECSRLDGSCDDCLNTTRPGPNCPTAECPSGKRGNGCDEDCSSTNCLYSQCGRYTDECISCPTGAYGELCQDRCPHCIEDTGCDQISGECLNGCSDGWYQLDCETECEGVCNSCERQSGMCITCGAGRWGERCELICSSNCVETRDFNPMVHCDKMSGACDEGACKIGFWREDCTQVCSNNCLQDSNNNRICAYLDGKCSIGCSDTYYGQTCDEKCSIRCRDQLCTDFENMCDASCADSYYGATCASSCSTHCAGQGKCNPATGNCNEGCELSYYGDRCDDPCKNTCLDGTCDDTGGCDDCGIIPVGPNCRAQVCLSGLYGPTCESNCPGKHCQLNQCHRHTGTCDEGCVIGYYGGFCTGSCQCDVPGTEVCDQEKGKCICKLGRHGTLCDQSCSDGCSGFECDRDGTCSNGCNTGRYGTNCDKACSNCLNEDCNAGNGNCLQGCVEGWFGPQCQSECSTECKVCHVQTGACLSCSTNYYSLPLCDKVCSNNCQQVGTDRMCNQANGACIFGCKSGYYNSDCHQSCGKCDSCDTNNGECDSCHSDWWGLTCKVQCSSNCARDGSNKECRQTDGYCVSGCVTGYFGVNCSEMCASTNCEGGGCDRQTGTCTNGCVPYFYGTDCKSRCDHCTDGTCNQNNGYCVGECPIRFYGNRCEDTCRSLCVDSACVKDTGYCTDCQISPKGENCMVQDPVTVAPTAAPTAELSVGAISAITACCVAFIIIFVIAIVCCMNYKRRYDDAKTEIHLPSDLIERMSTHRSLHSSLSANYPVARVVGDDEKDFVLF